MIYLTERRGDDDSWTTKRFLIQKSGVVASVTTNHTCIRHANIDRTVRHSVFHTITHLYCECIPVIILA